MPGFPSFTQVTSRMETAVLGDEQFQRAYDSGTVLSFDQTIGLALDEIPIPPST
jgi:hypothetical protein